MVFDLGPCVERPTILVLRQEAQDRLRNSCFRGHHVARAGNFFHWTNFAQVFSELRTEIVAVILAQIQAMVRKEPDPKNFSVHFAVQAKVPIGWAATARRTDYPDEHLIAYEPNRRSTALQVKIGSGHQAPHTSAVTLSCEFRNEREQRRWVVVAHSIYPGENAGRLEGNVTERTGLILFDWNHPGIPLRQVEPRRRRVS